MNIKELKKSIAELPDDMEIRVFDHEYGNYNEVFNTVIIARGKGMDENYKKLPRFVTLQTWTD